MAVPNRSTRTKRSKPKSWLLTTALAGLIASAAQAQVSVKLGILNDRSGLYSDLSGGEGSVIAARMAVEDFKAAEKGIKVEIISADHQNKPDIGSDIARQWYDQDGVDVILDVPTSSVGLAVAQVTREKQGLPPWYRLVPTSRARMLALLRSIGPYDTVGRSPTAPAAPSSKQGGDTWFFLTADYALAMRLSATPRPLLRRTAAR